MNLNYIEKGSGKPMILLHGNGSSHEYLSAQIEFFSKDRKVYALDTRGHGKSPKGNEPFTLSQFADDLYCFMKEKNIEKADILGHSDGGNIALIFALRHPEMIDNMILASANFVPEGLSGFFIVPVKIGLFFASAFENKSEKVKSKADLWRLMTNEPNITVDELKKINVRTLIISASFDVIKDSHTRLLHESIKNSVWIKLQGDHGLPHSKPDAFNAAVQKFLKQGD